MPNIRFSPVQGQVADFVLNHPTSSPFKTHNISFHIGGSYLSDFSDKGIKKFVQKHNDDLSYKEVGAFIQSVAANAPQMAGATFNLADKELGLYEKDAVNATHIKTGFTLETQSGTLPAQGVVFFDASKATFPLLDAENAIKTAEQKLKGAEKTLEKTQGKVEDAEYLRQRLVDFLGQDSPKDLAEKQSLVSSLESTVKDLKVEKDDYSKELKQLEDEHNNQTPNPPSGLDQAARWQRMTQLKRAIRGLDMEIKDSEKTVAEAKKTIGAKQGPLSFMGIGNSLSELHERNQNLSQAQAQLKTARQGVDSARQELDAAKALRERILRGEGIGGTQPAQPKPPVEAPAQPKPPEPVAPQPPVATQPPAQPKPPVAEEPIPKPVDEDILPPSAPPVTQPPAPSPQPAPAVPQEPVAAQPPVQQPAQPPVQTPAQPPAQQPVQPPAQTPVQQPVQTPVQQPPTASVTEETFIPGSRYNPLVTDVSGSAPAPAQPQQPLPVQPPVQQPIQQPAQPQTPAPVQAPAPVTPVGSVSKILYTVKKGDTLSSIARSELGNWKRWPEIAEMNKQTIGDRNNHWIYPGQVLTLPPLQLKPRPTN